MLTIIANAKIFDGERTLDGVNIVCRGSNIERLCNDLNTIDDDYELLDFADHLITPGFVDMQVNGGGGIMFNDNPSVETLQIISAAHRRYGTVAMLPTLITSDYEKMQRAIAAVDSAIEQAVPGIIGIHLEGPFINKEKSGVHDKDKCVVLDDEGLDIVCSLKQGVTMLTLAPELVDQATLSELSARGIIVCGGHSTANYQQSTTAMANGATGFTHLFNAMPPLLSREPGMVGAVLDNDDVWCSVIMDGFHIHPAICRLVARSKPRGKLVLVTDAMATVGAKSNSFTWEGEEIGLQAGKLQTKDGVFAGSHLNMLAAVKNAHEFLNIDFNEAVKMASLYPSAILGVTHQVGRIKAGMPANFIALTNDGIAASWINGEFVGYPT